MTKAEKLSGSRIKAELEIDKKTLDQSYDKVYRDLAKTVRVPGFRLGHTPRELLADHVDQNKVTAQAVTEAFYSSYFDFIENEKIEPIADPKIEVISQEPLKFSFVVAVRPEVKLGKIDKIKIPPRKAEASKKEIDELIKNMMNMSARFEAKGEKEKAKKGDLVHFTSKLEADEDLPTERQEAINKLKEEEKTIVLYDGYNLPEEDKNLEGLCVGDEKRFLVNNRDAKAGKDNQGKIYFRVKIKEIKKKVVPELNEEFLSETYGKEVTVEKFKEEVEKQFLADKKRKIRIEREKEFIAALNKNAQVDLPEKMIERENKRLQVKLKNNLKRMGISEEEFLRRNKKSKEDMQKEITKQAAENVKTSLVLVEIAKEKKIEITAKEIEKEIEKAIKQNAISEQDEKKIRKHLEGEGRDSLEHSLKIQRVFDIFLGQ